MIDVPVGYKQTDVGVIPEDWEVKLLPSTCWFQEGPGLRQWQFTKRGMKVINVTNLENGILNLDRTDRHISMVEFSKMYQHFAIDADDIVMASSGNSYGKAAIVRKQDLPLVMNTSVIRFKPLRNLNYHFLWIFLNSDSFKEQIDLMITGGAQPNFGPFHLNKISLSLPPTLTEQTAIATALSDVDALLNQLDKLIAKKRDIKQATMQQLLTGKKRLAGFSGEWEVKKLGDVASPSKNRIDPKKTDTHEFCIELEHIQSETGQLLGFTSTGEQSSLKTIFNQDDILFGKLRAYLRKYWYVTKSGICSTEIWALTPNQKLITSRYLFQIIQTDDFIDIATMAYGTHMPRSDWNIVKNYEVSLPPIEEQTAIATLLTDMDTEITQLQQRRHKTHALKQGMMQQLLTGKIRLVAQ